MWQKIWKLETKATPVLVGVLGVIGNGVGSCIAQRPSNDRNSKDNARGNWPYST